MKYSKDPMHDLNIQAQAELEWIEREKLVNQVITILRSLPLRARQEIFSMFCTTCGKVEASCSCKE